MREVTRSSRRVTSALSCLISEEELSVSVTVGVATSTTLSAMLASFVRSVAASAEVRNILTFAGSCCRNSSLKKALFSVPAAR